jgi:hypothetical protein
MPPGCTETSVPWATEIAAFRALAVAKLSSARFRPASACWLALESSGASQEQAIRVATSSARMIWRAICFSIPFRFLFGLLTLAGASRRFSAFVLCRLL